MIEHTELGRGTGVGTLGSELDKLACLDPGMVLVAVSSQGMLDSLDRLSRKDKLGTRSKVSVVELCSRQT